MASFRRRPRCGGEQRIAASPLIESESALKLDATLELFNVVLAIEAKVAMSAMDRPNVWANQFEEIERADAIGLHGGNCHIRGKKRYNFKMPIDLNDTLRRDPLLFDLATSSTFRRLAAVRFLGALDYAFVPSPNGAPRNQRHTRYSHSLGVMRLAQAFSNMVDFGERERRLVLAAALLHDIGHAPFSHTLEPFFEEFFHINHHMATIDIIIGKEHTDGEIPRILERYGVDPAEVASILSGGNDPTGTFFSGPINFDTIEAILRSCTYLPFPRLIPNPIDVLTAALERSTEDDCGTVDHFWFLKGIVYNSLIQSNLGLVADRFFQQVADRNKNILTSLDFLSDEASLFKKLPELNMLNSTIRHESLYADMIQTGFSFKKRNFYVNKNSNFFARKDGERYRQDKELLVFKEIRRIRGGIHNTEDSNYDNFI